MVGDPCHGVGIVYELWSPSPLLAVPVYPD
jgi:hypothetical protein